MLRDLLNKYIHPTDSQPVTRHRWAGACCLAVPYVCYGLSVPLYRLQRYVRGGGVAAVDVFLVDGLQPKEPRYIWGMGRGRRG